MRLEVAVEPKLAMTEGTGLAGLVALTAARLVASTAELAEAAALAAEKAVLEEAKAVLREAHSEPALALR